MNKDNDVITSRNPHPTAEMKQGESRTQRPVNRRQLLAGLAAGAVGLTAALVPALERQIRAASGSSLGDGVCQPDGIGTNKVGSFAHETSGVVLTLEGVSESGIVQNLGRKSPLFTLKITPTE